MQTIILGQLQFGPKSKHKAGEGLAFGKYKFFTSSDKQSKFLDSFDCEGPALIFGTGGKASVHYCEEKFATSTDCYSLTTDDKNIFLKYIYSYLRGNMYLLEEGFKGAGLEHISKNYLKQISIPLPPLATQRAIADKLDKLQSLIDLKKQAITKTDELAKSIFLEMFGDPMKNEKEREVKKFGEIGKLDRGISKHRPRNAPELLGGLYPLVQTGDVANSNGYITEYRSTYSELGLKQSKMWKKGTLCITIAANIAKTGILTFDACFPDSVVGFLPCEKSTTEYVQYRLSFLQKMLEDSAPESAQKNINLDILRKLNIPLPPLPLQQKFADIITQIEAQKSEHKLALAKLEELYQAEMQKSFSL